MALLDIGAYIKHAEQNDLKTVIIAGGVIYLTNEYHEKAGSLYIEIDEPHILIEQDCCLKQVDYVLLTPPYRIIKLKEKE